MAKQMVLTLEVFRRDGIGEFFKLTTDPVETIEEAKAFARDKAKQLGLVEGADYRIWTIR